MTGMWYENRKRNAIIIHMRKEGKSYSEIARYVGYSKGVVAGVVKRANLTKPRPVPKPKVKRGIRRIKHGKHAHPLVNILIDLMNEQECAWSDVATHAGVGYWKLANWKHRSLPTLLDLEACFGALGYELEVVKKDNANTV